MDRRISERRVTLLSFYDLDGQGRGANSQRLVSVRRRRAPFAPA